MLKPALSLAATGVIALLLWKVLGLFLLPLVGVLIGFAFLALKIGLLVGAVCFLLWLFRRFNRHADAS
jgi:hypothetical protein